MSPTELTHKLQDYKEELRNLRFNKVIGQLANTSRIHIVKRYKAKINTDNPKTPVVVRMNNKLESEPEQACEAKL